ncbi:MAG: hypothetical protein WAN86_19915, partial [Hyphomicrobiaceae bacterium]
AGYPDKPPASYQLNRQLAVWNLPPLVFRAFEAHCNKRKRIAPIEPCCARRAERCNALASLAYCTLRPHGLLPQAAQWHLQAMVAGTMIIA